MFRTILIRGAAFLFLLVFLILSAGFLALNTGLFMPLRQSAAERLLAATLESPVRVDGPVDIGFSETLEVRVKDVWLLPRRGDGKNRTTTFKSIELEIPYAAVTGGSPQLTGLGLNGSAFELGPDVAASDETGRAEGFVAQREPVLATLPGALLTSGVAENLRLSDIALTYTDEAAGWNETLEIVELTLLKPRDKLQIAVSGHARLNGSEVILSGGVDGREAGADNSRRHLRLDLRLDGLNAVVEGNLSVSSPVAALDATVESRSASLGTLLKTIAVAGPLDGKAGLKGKLTGPLDTLALSQLEAFLETAAGDRADLTGSIANLNAGKGLDVALKARLAPLPGDSAAPDDLLRFEVTGFDGRLSGGPETFSIEDAHVQTSLAVLKLGNAGPISVDRVVRNADDTVGLEGVRILHGPEDGPAFLELTGNVKDAIAFSGISFSGNLRVPVSEMIGFQGSDGKALGVLKGTLSVSDRSGSLSLDDLSAGLTETDLIALKLDLGIMDFRRISDITLKTRLDVPDFRKLAEAVGAEGPAKSLPFRFDGNLDVKEKTLAFRGEARSGPSPVRVNLSLGEDSAGGKTGTAGYLLTGSLVSDNLDPSDFAGIVSLAGRVKPKGESKVDLEPGTLETFRASVDLDVKKLVASGQQAGNAKGHLAYVEKVATLAPLELVYLGGRIEGDFTADFSATPAHLGAKGRVEKWRLGKLLAEIGHPVPFSSTLYLSFDLKSLAVRRPKLLKSLSGRVAASLWGGTIPTRLLDLSGLNLVRWLFSGGNNKQAEFVCAVLPFSFHDGMAASRSVILETKNVQIVGNGSVNLRTDALDFHFQPRPLRPQLVDIVSPFTVIGTMKDPKVRADAPLPARAAKELVTLPLNLAGEILDRKAPLHKEKPCRLPKTHGPK